MSTTHPGQRNDPLILTVNTGSSSLKVGLYPLDGGEEQVLDARIERIALPGSSVHITGAAGSSLVVEKRELPSHGAALEYLLSWIQEHGRDMKLRAIGHRVVHGGRYYSEPQRVTDELIAGLRELIPIDPNHLPQAIEAIEMTRHAFPGTLQVACFDTAFHRHMPRVAQLYALPRPLAEGGLIRYGFHGLSYEYVLHELATLDRSTAHGRVILAHLGNGASMAAVLKGRGIDTTMGFTPTGGLVMGTRSGDLDPGALLYLLQSLGMSPQAVSATVNREAGLLGVSGSSADMQDLLQREEEDPRAAEAIELFCYQATKFVGALTAALGGLDTLVFTGGIGEHAAPIRERICSDLGFLGIWLDPHRNARHAPVISQDESSITVRVIPTNEDRMIARHTREVLQEKGEARVQV